MEIQVSQVKNTNLSAEITLSTGAAYYDSETIETDFFGANFLTKFDRTEGTFLEKSEYLGVNLLRYPGGSMTEQLFDVNDPDATESEGFALEPLSDFLGNISGLDVSVVLVLPIKKYINLGVSVADAALEISNFVRRVSDGEFGDVKIDTFEIGNEFYLGNASYNTQAVTGSQYGEYASAFALAIKGAASYEVKVAVQIGTHWNDESIAIENNSQILSAFEARGALDAVDVLVAHNYAKNFEDVTSRLEVAIPESVLDAWAQSSGRELDIFVSEWNIKSVSSSPDGRDYGLAQASGLVEMVYQMIIYGVDMSAIWAVQQNNKTELASSEGIDEIRMAGEMFRMLSDSLVGTKALELPVNSVANDQVVFHAFENETKLVLFVSARDLLDNTNSFSVDISLDGLLSDFVYVWGEKLSTESDNVLVPNATPDVSLLFPTINYVDGVAKISIDFDRDYEVIKLVFLKDGIGNSGVHLIGDDIDDRLVSGRGSDFLEGRGGDDIIIGKAGDDVIDGGSGQDILKGGRDDDKLIGGENDDILRGGRDNDILLGGLGNDKLAGGKGIDVLEGGDGNDILWGGQGSDSFIFDSNSGNDKIRDFELGIDSIGLRELSFEEVTQIQLSTGLILEFGNSVVFITNFQGTLAETDFDFF